MTSLLTAIFFAVLAASTAAAASNEQSEAKLLCGAIAKLQGGAPGLIPSYPSLPSDQKAEALTNVAFVYDNALAGMALVACGDIEAAKRIGDAIINAQEHDRYYTDGRLRNAYLANDVARPAKLGGWWDKEKSRWQEDEYQASTAVGNMAWAALAQLHLYEATGEQKYLLSAEKIAVWISQFDTGTGVTGGFAGFEPSPSRIPWKSTEHNIDVAALGFWLTSLDKAPQWNRLHCSSADFVRTMFRPERGFLIGTTSESEPNLEAGIYLDVQLWPFLALRNSDLPAWKDIRSIIDKKIAVGQGYDFNDDRDGIWLEGTAQAALVIASFGDHAKAQTLLQTVMDNRDPVTGYILASDRAQISTRLTVGADGSGGDFNYYRWPHLGATAWAILALLEFNPFLSQRGHHAVWDRKQCS